MESSSAEDTVTLSKNKYKKMVEKMEQMEETIEVLSDKDTVKNIKDALKRIESGDFLTKEDIVF